MEITTTDRRRKLKTEDRREIHRRYNARRETGETCEGIAQAFGIERHYVAIVARSFATDEKGPISTTD